MLKTIKIVKMNNVKLKIEMSDIDKHIRYLSLIYFFNNPNIDFNLKPAYSIADYKKVEKFEKIIQN